MVSRSLPIDPRPLKRENFLALGTKITEQAAQPERFVMVAEFKIKVVNVYAA